jgi:hypothetical protein
VKKARITAMPPRTFLITGVSSGFGHAFGDRVVGSDAAAAASKALNDFVREVEEWAQLTGSTDYTT